MKITKRKHPTNEKIKIRIETDKYNDSYLGVMMNGFQMVYVQITPESVPLIIEALEEHFEIPSKFIDMRG